MILGGLYRYPSHPLLIDTPIISYMRLPISTNLVIKDQ